MSRNDYVLSLYMEFMPRNMWWCSIIIIIIINIDDVSCTISLYIIVVKGWEWPLCVDLDG